MRPEVRHRQRDQLREPLGQIRTGGSVGVGLPGVPAVDHDVGVGRQGEQSPAVDGVTRIQHRRPFVGVVQGERDAGRTQGGQFTAARTARRRLDLQDVGAQVGQQP